ncbi:MAG: hypothetical protein IT184_13810 [Acidobacteria bacterium]|nr:hypothetical protein [Acidobacteriota bacterium]
MGRRLRTGTWSGMMVVGLAVSPLAQSGVRQAGVAPAAVELAAHRPQEFAGTWTYNADQSVNAATGRPERSPRGATQRAGVTAARSPVPVTAGVPSSAMGPIGGEPAGTVPPGAFGFNRPSDVGPTVAMIQENRSLTRDLLEIPEMLTIRVDPQTVTFVDDLQRVRTYPVSGERRKYQLGAARFNAATFWSGSRLEKKIDAADGFRMTETYFLDEAASRLFVLLRVGSSRKGAPMMALNRVYDRQNQ